MSTPGARTPTRAHFVRDDWLSERLAKPAWKLRLSDDSSIQETLAFLASEVAGPAFHEARVPPTRTDLVGALESAGFTLVDTNIELRRTGGSIASGRAELNVRDARREDRRHVESLARTGFSLSRFHLDARISPAVADDLKAAWAGNFFEGARGDRLLVAEDGQGLCGFLLALVADTEVVIDLITVAERARRRGVGAQLVTEAGREAAGMRVGTQVANVPSLRFYESLGFTVTEATYVLHRHVS